MGGLAVGCEDEACEEEDDGDERDAVLGALFHDLWLLIGFTEWFPAWVADGILDVCTELGAPAAVECVVADGTLVAG